MNVPLHLSHMVLAMLIFCFSVGVLLGGIVVYFMLRPGKQVKKLLSQISQLEKERNDYHEKVGAHFVTTAKLVNQLTESYRDVHQHLTSGVHELCDNKNVQSQLDTWSQTSNLGSENLSENIKKLSAIPPKDYVANRQY